MKKMVRWTPSRELSSVWDAFDRMFEHSYAMPVEQARSGGLAPDVAENDTA